MDRNWQFDDGKNGFRYADDLFGNGPSGRYARGKYAEDAGEDGALFIRLGGRDGRDVSDLSGGWTRSFETDEASEATVSIRFKLKASGGLEADEYGAFRAALDGVGIGQNGQDHIARIHGDGDGGGADSTGWLEVTLPLGVLDAGRHALDLGGYLNARTGEKAHVKILIDEVRLSLEPTGAALDPFEAEVLRLTNEFRAENGLDPLAADARLTAAAEGWSREMAEGDFFAHSDTQEIVAAEGYDWTRLGENIAAGYQTPDDVVEGWIASDGHRANLLSENFEEIGIGYHFRDDDGGDAPYGHYWTQVFGTEADSLI